jgi:uncharacterized membrane protein YkoI
MRFITMVCVTSGLAIALAGTAGAQESGEKKINMKNVPAAVQQAITKESAGAKLKGLATEVEDGKRLYEAEFDVNGHARDVSFDENGAVVSVEEEIALDKIPAPARAAIEKAAGTGKVTMVETITAGGTLAYEAQLNKSGKKSEIKVDAAGRTVK